MSSTIRQKLGYLIVFILLPALFTGFFPGKIVVIRALCYFYICFLAYKYRKQFNKNEFKGNSCIKLLLFFGGITYIRGFFNIADSNDLYNQFSNLIFTSFLLPLYVYLSSPEKLIFIWRSFLTSGLIICLGCFFFPPTDGFMSFQQNMMFLNGFLLCIPFVKRKYVYIFVGLSIWALVYDLDRRSVLLGSIIPFVLMLFYKYLTRPYIKTAYFICSFLLPIFLIVLGIIGVFNVFQGMQDLDQYSLNESGRSVNTDSRTSIYMDVLLEIDKQDAYWFGLGGNGKTETSLSDISYADFDEIYKHGRGGTESGMLNFIQYGGLFGWLVYTFFFITVSYYGLYKSKNKFVILIALYTCFRYVYSYIEDVFTTNGHTFYNMLLYGICLSKKFRDMNNVEIKRYLRIVFK